MPTLIEGATALLPDGPAPASVLIDGGRIAAVGSAAVVPRGPGIRRIDAAGLILAPGLIDLQLNGGFGADFTTEPRSIWAVANRLPEHGVTAFLPTLVSPSAEMVAAAIEALAAGPPDGHAGAVPLGWHVEGPFIHPDAAGAHDVARLRLPDPAFVERWTPDAGVRLVTLAPELPGALEVARALSDRGVVVAAGHSTASYEQGAAGIAAGVRYATHLFNAMPPIRAREPGLALALLEDPRVVVGLIPDGIHLDPAVVRLVQRLVGSDRLSVVTDSTAALGMPDGEHVLAGRSVVLSKGEVRDPEGRLAGSSLAADEAVRNLAAVAGLAPGHAIAAMTSVPARLLGIETERGAIAPGTRADLVLFDQELRPVAVLVAGELVHGDDGSSMAATA